MTVQIDKAGRIVLPKPVRDRLGLRAGSDVELKETTAGVILKAREHKPALIQKQGLWVYTGEVPEGSLDVVQNGVHDEREARIRKLAGIYDLKIYLDTNALVAAFVANHPHHAPAFALLLAVKKGNHQGFVSTHGLAELYAVLTRAPFRPRVHPTDAGRFLDDNIYPYFELTQISAKDYQDVLKTAQRKGWIGGIVFDALHMRCAQKAHCDRLYTFNVKDFRALAGPEMAEKISAP